MAYVKTPVFKERAVIQTGYENVAVRRVKGT